MANKVPHLSFKQEYQGFAKEIISDVKIVNPLTKEEREYKALWDTGATHTVITPKVLQELNLAIVDKTTIIGVNSKNENIPVALFDLLLVFGINISIEKIRGAVCIIGGNADILIGMDIIRFGDFSISNGGGKTLFSFAFPPFENKTDLVEKANRVNKNNKVFKK
ncbi:retropepsin-like aspartic protease [uncultured Brachyspira sp.]|uniref:retropepsin-like aspartic protease n=1 Tax=uncultured Brachyspira sp. TaxID=221953 RepID=UPI00321F6781